MKIITLHILPDGRVNGLYTEAIDLGSLGTLRIERASTIEFDNAAQLWRVFNRQGRCINASPSRSDCLNWEEDFFNANIQSEA